MAQRYGRRRKRAHLAKIAALTEAHERETALAREGWSKARQLESEMEAWDDEITRLLGELSAFRRETPVIESRTPMREVSVRSRLRNDFQRMVEVGQLTEITNLIRERMLRFIVSCERDDIQQRRIIRFIEADGRADQLAYAMSEVALRSGFGERDVEYLSREIARQMGAMINSRKSDAKFTRC